jgi:hypothetical protein
MKKIMLIAGCSHAAGSEIDGGEDSRYNRDNSFGNLLAKKLGYDPINIALCGANNQGVARSILDWVSSNYDSNSMELFVLVAWTESSRMEIPSTKMHTYDSANKYVDYFKEENKLFLRVNYGSSGGDNWEQEQTKYYQEFMARNSAYLEILNANLILQIQYFLRYQNIKYLMCNTMGMFTDNIYTKTYIEKIDQSRYCNMLDDSQSFYFKYKNAGYTNIKAKYWHHNEVPHSMYANDLYKFITSSPL